MCGEIGFGLDLDFGCDMELGFVWIWNLEKLWNQFWS